MNQATKDLENRFEEKFFFNKQVTKVKFFLKFKPK